MRNSTNRIEQVNEISVPREVYETEQTKQLHILCDASKIAYSAVVHCKIENDCNLIRSQANGTNCNRIEVS